MKILIVEDSLEQRELADAAIEDSGHQAIFVNDLIYALYYLGLYDLAGEILQKYQPRENDKDILKLYQHRKLHIGGVITDLYFPVLDGVISKPDGRPYGKEFDPLGLTIVGLCQQQKIPCVINTDVHHHNSGWIKLAAMGFGIGCIDDKSITPESWQKAISFLEEKSYYKLKATFTSSDFKKEE